MISKHDERVKIAIDLWAKNMRNDKAEVMRLGYGKLSMYGQNGMRDYEDLEESTDKTLIQHVQAVYDGLSATQKTAINHYHLGAKAVCDNIELQYMHAIEKMTRGLQIRGML